MARLELSPIFMAFAGNIAREIAMHVYGISPCA
jgi:hypothetical protein